MVEAEEQVSGEERPLDGVPEGSDGVIADSGEVEREVCCVAGALEVGVGPSLGLGVGVDAGPPNAVARHAGRGEGVRAVVLRRI